MSCPMGPPCELWILSQFSLSHSPPLTSHSQKTIFFYFLFFSEITLSSFFLAFSDISCLTLSLLSEERVSLIFIHLYFLRPIKQELFSLSLSLSVSKTISFSWTKQNQDNLFPVKKIQEAAPLQNLYITIKHRKKSEKLQRDSVCITHRERERERDRQTHQQKQKLRFLYFVEKIRSCS